MNKDFIFSAESNPTDFSLVKDWSIGISLGSEFASQATSNVYAFGIAKTFGSSNLYFRYSPGFFKQFVLTKNQAISGSDTSYIPLKTNLKYQEYFSTGYSYRFTDNLSGGFTLRYFVQQF
ncbi:MAG: hypothetical protein WC727_11770, partial [Ignavibacteriaceae bacterium]